MWEKVLRPNEEKSPTLKVGIEVPFTVLIDRKLEMWILAMYAYNKKILRIA